VAGTLAGGTFLDAFDRRKILITAQIGYLASSGLLFAGAVHGDPPLALIYVAVAGIAATSAIDGPTRSAMTPRCLDRSQLPAAAALNQIIWNGAGLVGPALAGDRRRGLRVLVGVRDRPDLDRPAAARLDRDPADAPRRG
jgi:MFS family permease